MEKAKRSRGEGRIYQRGRIWWVQYSRRGTMYRESSRSEKKLVAERLLRKRLGEVETGNFVKPSSRRLTYTAMADAMLRDYKINELKSLARNTQGEYVPGEPQLRRFLARKHIVRALDVGDVIKEYIDTRKNEGAANATINRSLSALSRMFRLAVEDKKLRPEDVPLIKKLKESNTRKGFFKDEEYVRLRGALPDYIKPLLTMGYYTGMRLGEICSLKWEQVDLMNNEITLDPRTTKNDDPRTIPFSDLNELREVIKMQFHKVKGECPECPYVFFKRGKRIRRFDKAWRKACIQVGLGRTERTEEGRLKYVGRIFHDLRRTGVRNMIRAGISETVAQRISGHKSNSVFKRYDITSKSDLDNAGRKLGKHIEGERHNTSTMEAERIDQQPLTN